VFGNIAQEHYPSKEVTKTLIEDNFFAGENSVNEYFYTSSNEKMAFNGVVVDWVDVDGTLPDYQALTADQYAEQRDLAISQALTALKGKQSDFDLDQYNIVVLYIHAPGKPTEHLSFNEFDNQIKAHANTADEKIYALKGVNVFVNSPIFKSRSSIPSEDDDSRILPNYQWIKTMFKSVAVTNNSQSVKFNKKSNTLKCGTTNPGAGLDFADNCQITQDDDPYDVLGNGLYATDLNCYHKLKAGWITDTDVITIENPDVNNPDFKPRDVGQSAMLNSLVYRNSTTVTSNDYDHI